MDGKQARRTGSGSPMGALFDHGCDAFTVILSGCVGAKIFSVGNGFWGSLAIFGPSLSFWWVTLEQYYSGHLYLAPITGPDDTQIMFCGLMCLGGYLTPLFFAELQVDVPYVGQMQFTHCMHIVLSTFWMCGSTIEFTRNIISAWNTRPLMKRRFNAPDFIKQVVFWPLCFAIWLLYQ